MLRNSTITLAQARQVTARELATLPTDQLALLLEAVTENRADAVRLADKVNEALGLRFAEIAAQMRRVKGLDTGTVTFDDDGHEVKADLPKAVVWDSEVLAEIEARIAREGEDPAEYIHTKRTVRESAWRAWPAGIKAVFAPARTVRVGKPSYAITKKGV